MSHRHESQPSEFLVENLALLPSGRVLDVAMGSGRNSIYLASKGFKVEGVDISPDSVREAIENAHQSGVTIKTTVADLEKDYRIEENTFDVIICFNYLQRSLIPRIKDGLKSGGMVVYETFIVDHARLFGKPSNPDYLLKHNERLFNNSFQPPLSPRNGGFLCWVTPLQGETVFRVNPKPLKEGQSPSLLPYC